MNLGEKIKAEIIRKPIKSAHCQKAFLAGVLRGSGEIFYSGEELGVQFNLSSEQAVMLVSDILRQNFNYQVREVSVGEDRLNKKDKFVVSIIGGVALDILTQLEILVEVEDELTVNFNFYGEITKKECCLYSFLAGLFISSGSCTAPDDSKATTGYHLELVFSHSAPAGDTAGILLIRGIQAKIMRRKEHYVVYVKSAESIKDFLALIKAYVSVLEFTDILVLRGMANKSNRQKNCDLGNVNKQVEASVKQIKAIEKLERNDGLNLLSDDLKRVCVARKENPDETLLELAERLNVSKSCLNHRLRKIISLADGL